MFLLRTNLWIKEENLWTFPFHGPLNTSYRPTHVLLQQPLGIDPSLRHVLQKPRSNQAIYFFRQQVGAMHASSLTSNMWAIRPSLAWSKWNMEEICGLKFQLSYVDMPQNFLWKFLHAHTMSFYNWICTFDQKTKCLPRWRPFSIT